MRKKKAIFGIAGAVLAVVFAGTAWFNRVTCDLSKEDRVFIAAFLKGENVPEPGVTYAAEVLFIRGAQRAVLQKAFGNDPVPYGRPREPRDVYLARSGLCYDRSRVIEKILQSRGFATRHVSVYASGASFPWVALARPGVASHAVTEVWTRAGWLVVDSNRPWVSVDRAGWPVSLARMRRDAGKNAIVWPMPEPVAMDPIFTMPFVYVYGLYSRHGQFYPPYTPFPDICWPELADNFSWSTGK